MSVRNNIFNASRRKVGGIWFIKLGKINLSFCVSRQESERAINTRVAKLNERGITMQVNYDH